jgi:hypothetical protein
LTTVHCPPAFSIAATSTIVCPGKSATLTPSGGVGYTWTAPSGVAGLTNNPLAFPITSATNFSLFGIDQNGCNSGVQQPITVHTFPPMNISPPSFTCIGKSKVVSASGANSYTWNTGANTSAITVTVTAPSGFTVSGTHLPSGCVSTRTTLVSVVIPTFQVTPSSSPLYLCPGNTVTMLTASGGNSYTWSSTSGGQSNFPTYMLSGVSQTVFVSAVTVSMNTSCVSSKTIPVIPVPPSLLNTNVSYTSACSGESVSLVAFGANSYTWSNGVQGSVNVVAPAPGTTVYTVSNDTTSCNTGKSVTVEIKPWQVLQVTANPSVVCAGEPVFINASGAASFSVNGMPVTSTTALFPLASAVVTVTGNSDAFCHEKQLLYVVVNPCTGLAENGGGRLRVYPNPGNGIFHVLNPVEATVALINANGASIRCFTIPKGGSTIDMTDQPAGIYVLVPDSRQQRAVRLLKTDD